MYVNMDVMENQNVTTGYAGVTCGVMHAYTLALIYTVFLVELVLGSIKKLLMVTHHGITQKFNNMYTNKSGSSCNTIIGFAT